MTTIIAKGIIGKKAITVICSGNNDKPTVTFNGKENESLLKALNLGIKMAPSMGNNFYFDEPTIAAYYHVLNTIFFEKLNSIEVDGEIEPIPWEKDLIY